MHFIIEEDAFFREDEGIDLLTPPQTPLVEDLPKLHQDHLDFEVFFLNFNNEVIKDDKIMWSGVANSRPDSSCFQHCGEQRMLITPLNFADEFVMSDELMLTPVNTDSEDEIDVVGISEPIRWPSNDSPGPSIRAFTKEDTLPLASCPPNNGFPASLPKSKKGTKKKRKGRDNKVSSMLLDSSDESCSSDSTSTRVVYRSDHNNLERKRRVELKRKFDELRVTIPDICTNERAAKVVVLNKAIECIRSLHCQSSELSIERDNLQKMNRYLRDKLQNLSCVDIQTEFVF